MSNAEQTRHARGPDERNAAAQAALADPTCDGCGDIAPLTVDDRHGFHLCQRCQPREVQS